jgi:AcrR family transcriptional regulator
MRRSRNKKREIVAATVRLVARQGVNGTSVRQIAAAAGVTEGALYRHFKGKDDLCQQIYFAIVSEMAAYKEKIVASSLSIQAKVREWVRISYEYFDRFPDAFAYVFFTDHDFPENWKHITTGQSRLFSRLLAQMERVPVRPEVAVSHFTGLMLNVPRLIREGLLDGPASQYTDEVVEAVYRVFRLAAPVQAAMPWDGEMALDGGASVVRLAAVSGMAGAKGLAALG